MIGYASCVYSILDILSQRLDLQCHYNDTLPDLANVLQNNLGGFIATRHQIITARSLSISCWRFIQEEWIDKYIRKAI